MDGETVVPDFFARFPRLHAACKQKFAYLGNEVPDPHLVFGSVLLPTLEDGLTTGNLAKILPICAFLEDVAQSARNDPGLESLLKIEVGEWLGGIENEAFLMPWLGQETKRICRYVPGLATQRLTLRNESREHSLMNRVRRLLSRFTPK